MLLRETTLEQYHNDKYYDAVLRLPDSSIGLFPGQIDFEQDPSVPVQWNDRFIEFRQSVKDWSIGLSIVTLIHHVLLIGVVGVFSGPTVGSGEEMFVFFFLALYLFWLVYTVYRFTSSVPMLMRFNRQAQLAHFRDANGAVATVPWRQLRAYIRCFGIYSEDSCQRYRSMFFLEFLFVDPNFPSHTGEPAVRVVEDFATPEDGLADCLSHYEKIRQYMERGPEALRSWQEPAGRSETATDTAFGWVLLRFLGLVLHLAAGGPLIRYWAARKDARRGWPEDVERLCAPGAELTGFDTQPVRSQEGAFYTVEELPAGIRLVPVIATGEHSVRGTLSDG